MFASHHTPSPLKGLLAGLAGGLVASWVMNQFQTQVPAEAFAKLLGERDAPSDGDSGSDEEPATVKAAETVSESVLDHRLTTSEKKWAGPTVHYSLGGSAGAAYGIAAEYLPDVTAGGGLPFGTAFWLAADEVAVPALGLSDPPWTSTPSTHVYALASHLVYGLVTEITRRGVRTLLD